MTDHFDDSSGPRRPKPYASRGPQGEPSSTPRDNRYPADRDSRFTQPDRPRPSDRGNVARPSGPRHGFRYRVDLEYLGTRYSGWQFQTNARTVAGEIMEAIHRATGQRVIEVYGSGRTDAGVHAIHQVAHIDLAKQIDPDELLRAVNDELPGDINLLKIELAQDGFHARHSATARSYVYRISRRRSAFDKPVVWWVKDSLDVAAMGLAARALTGLHDFAAFAQADPSKPDESTKVKVEMVEVREDGPNIFIRIQGSHFLWKMVRRIVGVLVEVGRGNLKPGDVARIMAANGASVAEYTAPPSGLSLEKVTYGVPASDFVRPDVRPERTQEKRDFEPAPNKGDRPPYRPKPAYKPRADQGNADRPREFDRPKTDRPAYARPSGFDSLKPKSGFRPQGERSGAGGDRPEGGWPRQSTSREFPPGQGKQTFRRRG